MKRVRLLVVVTLAAIGAIYLHAVISRRPTSLPPVLKVVTTQVIFGGYVELSYPASLDYLPGIDNWEEQRGTSAFSNIKNFKGGAYGYPYAGYLGDSDVFIEEFQLSTTSPASLSPWLRKQLSSALFVAGGDNPELLQFIDENAPRRGTLLSERSYAIRGVPAIERRLLFSGTQGSIHAIFTYLNTPHCVLLVVSYSDTPSARADYAVIVNSVAIAALSPTPKGGYLQPRD